VWLEGPAVHVLCCATRLIAAARSCFPLFGWGEYVPELYGLSCTVAWKRYRTSVENAAYVICSFACSTLIPVLLIIVSQCRILHAVDKLSCLLTTECICTHLRNAEKHLPVMFFCISLGFIIAWASYMVVSFIFHRDHWNLVSGGFVFPVLFAKSSHIYNPFIYLYFNKAFRQELQGLLTCVRFGWVPNCVRAHSSARNQAPLAIEIQLQEQGPWAVPRAAAFHSLAGGLKSG
ncbi:hypothetical protein Z043_125874, partial [Scleropages formosus]